MTMHGPFPRALFLQALLEGWTLTDPSGVVNTVTDGSGFTDILTTANAGTFYFTKALESFRDEKVDGANDVLTVLPLVRLLGTHDTFEPVIAGLSDNSDPTAGGAKWEGLGYRYNGADYDLVRFTELGGGAAAGASIDRSLGVLSYHLGRSERAAYVYGYSGTTYTNFLGATLDRAITPTHLMVRFDRAATAVATRRIGVGFHVGAPITSLDIAARL